MTMTVDEMKDFMKEELESQYKLLMRGEENHYSYLFMIANDMGLTTTKEEEEAK